MNRNPMEDFKITDSRRAYSGRVINLSVEKIAVPDGTEITREVVQHPGAVAIVPMISSDQVVMIRQFRHSVRKVLWEIPAGTLEPGESPVDCARRELEEETGYRAAKMRPLGGFYTSPGFSDEFLHLFLATELEPCELNLDSDEQLEVHEMSLKEAFGKLENGDIIDAKTIVGLLRADRLKHGNNIT